MTEQTEVTLVILATNRYIELAELFIKDMKLRHDQKETIQYLVLTDMPSRLDGVDYEYIPHEQWPLVADKKFQYVCSFKDKIKGKYVFVVDADTRVNNKTFTFDVFKYPLVGITHYLNDGWVKSRQQRPYDSNRKSSAYVKPEDAQNTSKFPYLMSAFFGGLKDNVVKMCESLAHNTMVNYDKKVKARVDDESHLNAYNVRCGMICLPFTAYGSIFIVSDKNHIPEKLLRNKN